MSAGHCKHGMFDLANGCPQCIAERMGREGNTEASIAEEIAKVNNRELDPEVRRLIEVAVEAEGKPTLIKVQYYSESSGEVKPRQYTYYSVDRLEVGDIVTVPVRDATGKAKVSAIDVPEAEIASFKDKVKTIQADMVIPRVKPEQEEMEEGLNAEGLTLRQPSPLEDIPSITTGDIAETAIVLRPGEDVDARDYFEQATIILGYAERRTITTLDDNKAANDDLTIISRLKKKMEVKKREYLDPLRDQAEAIRETYSTLMDPIFAAEKITKDKMLAYSAEQDRIRKEQEEINRKRIEAAEAEMKLKGELTESVNLVEVIPEPAKRVSTDMGTSGKVDNWKWEVTEFSLVPDEYKMINPAILTPTAKSYKNTRTIPGIRIYNEPGISTRAR